MKLLLPYIKPKNFVSALINKYGFDHKQSWNASFLTMPSELGEGGFQLFAKNDIHFFRGKWHFAEETMFYSSDTVGKYGYIDFRISSKGDIQSAAIEGKTSFETDITEIDGLRIFISPRLLQVEKGFLKNRFDRSFLDLNVSHLIQNIFLVNAASFQDSILLESRILNFLYYWMLFLQGNETGEVVREIKPDLKSKVALAKELLDNGISTPITIRQLSRLVGTNEQDLKRSFHALVGLPIRQYLIAKKMDQARMMIQSTDMNMFHICNTLGYSNRSHFTNLYKRFFGVNPLNDRNHID